MNMGRTDTWDEELIEAFKHNRWLLMQELGNDYYKLSESNDREGEDQDQAMRRMEWEKEEEKAKIEYLRVIADKEKRGFKTKTTVGAICRKKHGKTKRKR